MENYISNFNTTAQYEAAKGTLDRPHVSLVEEGMSVHYDEVNKGLVMYIDNISNNSYSNDMDHLIEDPEGGGAHVYVYQGEQMKYGGSTYYLWQRDDDDFYDTLADTGNAYHKYMLTDTVNYNDLYSQSLEYDSTNQYQPTFIILNEDMELQYPENPSGHKDTIIKVERLDNTTHTIHYNETDA